MCVGFFFFSLSGDVVMACRVRYSLSVPSGYLDAEDGWGACRAVGGFC